MVNKYDVKQFAEKYPEKCWYVVNDDMIVNKETNKSMCHIDEFVNMMRKKMHCDFECIHSCHGLLEVTYRCKDCGTVIFASDDESYDPHLCCPGCSDYKTGFAYWTGEEIAASEEKQNAIKALEQRQAEQIAAEKRREQRGKYDWEVGSGKIKLFKRAIFWDLECDNLFKTKLKGLKLGISWAYKENGSFYSKKHWIIPLSISALRSHIHFKKNKKALLDGVGGNV